MSPILGSRGISPRGYGFAGAGKPNAPTSVSASDVGTSRAYNNGAASVSFSSGGDNGAPISSYEVTSSPGGFTASGSSSPLTVEGLQSGVSYTFTVTATNSVGTSDASSASSAITATTIPQVPTIGTATCATGQAYTGSANISVPFTAGATGGKTVTYYVTSSSSATGNNTSSPVTVSETVGNPTSTARTYTVVATNANGSSSASSASNSVAAVSVPQAPTIGTASDGGTGTTATVTYTANATGGASVSAYTATSSPSSLTGTGSSPITVSGLTAGTAYTFTVTATNTNGTSIASAASNSVTPAVPTSYESIASFTPTSGNSVTFSSIPQGYKSLQLRIVNRAASSGATMYLQFNGTGGTAYDEQWFSNYNNSLYSNYNTNVAQVRIGNYVNTPNNTYPTTTIVDIMDYTNTSKNKTVMSHSGTMLASATGYDNGGMVGTFRNTASVTSIFLYLAGQNFAGTGNTISLYGVK